MVPGGSSSIKWLSGVEGGSRDGRGGEADSKEGRWLEERRKRRPKRSSSPSQESLLHFSLSSLFSVSSLTAMSSRGGGTNLTRLPTYFDLCCCTVAQPDKTAL